MKGSVQAISIKRRSGTTLLKIRDTEDVFSSIIVQIPLGSAKIVDELRRRGYLVTDERWFLVMKGPRRVAETVISQVFTGRLATFERRWSWPSAGVSGKAARARNSITCG